MLSLQLKLKNGDTWEAFGYGTCNVLTRKAGDYHQYKEEHDTEDELKQSMEKIAPLEQWEEWRSFD